MSNEFGENSIVLPLMCFLLFKGAFAFSLYWWGRWVARRHESSFWIGVKWLPVAAFTLGAMGAAYTMWQLVRVFDAIAFVEAEHKAQMLAQGISETMNAAMIFVLPSFALEAFCLAAFMVGTLMKPTKQPPPKPA